MAVLKATPKGYLQGIQDLSRRAPVSEPEQIPQHLPHLFLFTERGPTEPHLVSGAAAATLYGAKSFDLTQRFSTHQTVLAQAIMAAGNSVMIQRVIPTDSAGRALAGTALLRVSLEVIRTQLPVYKRNPDGSIKLTSTGERDVDATAAPIEGYRGVLWTSMTPYPLAAQKKFGTGAVIAGRSGATIGSVPLVTLSTYGADAEATVYPLFDLEVSSPGAYGTNIGMRLWGPNSNSQTPNDAAYIESVRAFMYRFAFIERDSAISSPNLLTDIGGERSSDLCFIAGAMDGLGRSTSVQDSLVQNYQDVDTVGSTPLYGPFKRVHVYESNLETVLSMLTLGADDGVPDYPVAQGERQFDATSIAQGYGRTVDTAFGNLVADNKHMFNLFTGVDHYGVPYDTYTVEDSVRFGGVAFGEGANHYAAAGTDGLSASTNATTARIENFQLFDKEVARQLSIWGTESEVPMLDDAKYPVSAVWDSGFALETKKKFLIPMSRRKDIIAHLCTQEVGGYLDPKDEDPQTWSLQPQNDESAEQAIAQQLRLAAELYPESEVYGTPVCRAIIFGHSGQLLNTPWKHTTPLIVDFASKVAGYMGAGDGNWVNSQAFDVSPANQITMFRTSSVNLTWKTDGNYHKNWDNGIIFVKNYDRSSLFVPAFQTVYPDDTSVLNNYFTVAAAAFLEKVAQQTWRDLTGMSLTAEQFIERSNKLIANAVAGRFDGRFVIVPNTFMTGYDEQRGFSWSCNIELFAPTMRTVGSFTIISRRIEDLTAAP